MDTVEVEFKVDGETIPEEDIRRIERDRYNVAFANFYEAGCKAKLDGKELTYEECKALTLPEATEALAQLKEELGNDGIERALAPVLEQGYEQWRDIAARSRRHENLTPGFVEIEAKGLSLIQFLMANQLVMKENSVGLASRLHPEHYYFKRGKGGEQLIAETFGEYGAPVRLDLKPDAGDYRPVPLDDDTLFAMTGTTYLAKDHEDSKIVGMHQFKDRAGGIGIKMGVFLPEAAPPEVRRGHQEHMLVEFNNIVGVAKGMAPNVLQRFVMGRMLKRMIKKQSFH